MSFRWDKLRNYCAKGQKLVFCMSVLSVMLCMSELCMGALSDKAQHKNAATPKKILWWVAAIDFCISSTWYVYWIPSFPPWIWRLKPMKAGLIAACKGIWAILGTWNMKGSPRFPLSLKDCWEEMEILQISGWLLLQGHLWNWKSLLCHSTLSGPWCFTDVWRS